MPTQQLSAPAVVLLAIAASAGAASDCPYLDQNRSAEPLTVNLNTGPALLLGLHDGQLFGFGSSPACAGCEVEVIGSFYDPCTNEWQIQRLPAGKGFRLWDGSIQRIGHRIIALTIAVRRNPALSPESDYMLLDSDTRGVVFDLRQRKLSAIAPHGREWRSGEDIIDGFFDTNGRYVVYVQMPRGRGARVFVYDGVRGRWAGSFNAPPGLGALSKTPDSELWFELHSPGRGASRYFVFSPADGSMRRRSGPPPAPVAASGHGALEVRNLGGVWSGAVSLSIERPGRRYELRLGVRSVPVLNNCEKVEHRPCDPVEQLPVTRLEAALHPVAPPPTAQLRYYKTCGDAVCSTDGYRGPFAGVPRCEGPIEGRPCAAVGETCDLVNNCNMLLVCAESDPSTRCPR